jgi:MTH538 TIR-like domain (DUF1863)
MNTPSTSTTPAQTNSTTPPTRSAPYRFDAFISYSHSADHSLAPALREALHRLAKPWYRKRALRIFLDEAAMSTEPALWSAIEHALKESGSFLLLLSPQAAGSVWVNREIATWVEARGTGGLHLALTQGELEWSETLGDFDPEQSTALPDALRGVFGEVPRHLDLRWTRDATDLTLGNPRFLDDVADLAAPLHGRSKDELVGSDVTEHRRTMRVTRAAIATLSVLLIVAVFAATLARSNARRAETRRVDAQASRLRTESQASGQVPDLSFLLAAQSYRMRPESSALAAMVATTQRVPDLKHLIRTHTERVIAIAVSDDGKTSVSLDDAGGLVSIDTRTGKVNSRSKTDKHGSSVNAVGSQMLVSALGKTELRDSQSLKVIRSWDFNGSLVVGAAVTSDRRAAFATSDGRVALASVDSDRPLEFVKVIDIATNMTASKAVIAVIGTDAGRNVVVGLDPNGLTKRWQSSTVSPLSAVAISGDGSWVVAGTSLGTTLFFDASTGEASTPSLFQPTSPPTGFASNPNSPYMLQAGQAGDYSYIVAAPKGRSSYPPYRLFSRSTVIAWSRANIAAAAGADGVVAILDTVDNPYPTRRFVSDAKVLSAVSEDGRTAASVDQRGTVAIHRVSKNGTFDAGAPLGNMAGPASPKVMTLLGPSAVVVGDESGNLRVFGKVRNRSVDVFVAPAGVGTIGRLAALGSDRVAVIWGNSLLQILRVEGNRLSLERTLSDRATALATQPAGGPTLAYFEGSEAVVIVDGSTGAVRTRLTSPQPGSRALALDATASLVAVADATQVRIWDINKRVPVGGPVDGQGEVQSLAFTDGSRRLLVATTTAAVGLIDVATGGSAGRYSDEDGGQLVSFGPTLTSADVFMTVVTASGRPVIAHWTFDPKAVVAEGCRVFGRPFSESERDRFDLGSSAPCDAVDGIEALANETASTEKVGDAEPAGKPVPSQRAVVDDIIKFASPKKTLIDCLRSALDAEPWASVAEMRAAKPLPVAFAARWEPFRRRCENNASESSGKGGGLGLLNITPFTASELTARWNAALRTTPTDLLGPLSGSWTDSGTSVRGRGGIGVDVIALSDASSPSLPSNAPIASLTTSHLAIDSVPTHGQVAAADRDLRAIQVTIRPVPDAAEVRSVVRALATIVEGRAMAPVVDEALTDGPMLAAFGRSYTTTTQVAGASSGIAAAVPTPASTLTTARVGRAIYGLSLTPGTALIEPGLSVSVTF